MKKPKIFSVIGARPHFVKAAPFMKAMENSGHEVVTVHSGQHYDQNMSDIFFQELGMPTPHVNLGVGSGTHAKQTAQVLVGVEELLLQHKPQAVVVYGDTNTTLGAALAAAKQYCPVIHVEAGVRCGNRRMPEEINRALIDNMSDYLACPSEVAAHNLRKENVSGKIENVGDFMFDTFLEAQAAAANTNFDLDGYGVTEGGYYLSTLHREEITASADVLRGVLDTLGSLDRPVILPLHPRTRACLDKAGIHIERGDGLKIVEPVGYLEMVNLLMRCRMVLTDSGGLQKEAYWAGVPCVTMMNETTWTEIIDAGWSVITGLDATKIRAAVSDFEAAPPASKSDRSDLYGAAGSAQRMVESLGWV